MLKLQPTKSKLINTINMPVSTEVLVHLIDWFLTPTLAPINQVYQ
jgi:hypothetical protein